MTKDAVGALSNENVAVVVVVTTRAKSYCVFG